MLISYSSLKIYLNCPKKYSFAKKGKIVEVKKPWVTGGKAWHKVLERLAGRDDYNRVSVVSVFEQAWKKYALNNFYGRRQERDIHNFYTKDKIVKNVLEILDNLVEYQVLIKEFPFILNFGEYKITGVIDLFRDGEIWDYKFTKSEDYDEMQLYIYYLAMKKLGFDCKSIGYINGLSGNVVKKSIEEIQEEGLIFDKAIEVLLRDKTFESRPSTLNCEKCSYRKMCKDRWRGSKINLGG